MFKKHDYTLGVLWAAAIFILPLPFIQTLEAGLPAIYYPQKLPIIAGTIAYVWLLLAIYLTLDRPAKGLHDPRHNEPGRHPFSLAAHARVTFSRPHQADRQYSPFTSSWAWRFTP